MRENGPLKIAVVGLGRIAWQYHIPCIIRDARFQLTAVTDPFLERLEEAEKTFGITRTYRELSLMLENET